MPLIYVTGKDLTHADLITPRICKINAEIINSPWKRLPSSRWGNMVMVATHQKGPVLFFLEFFLNIFLNIFLKKFTCFYFFS